MMTAISNTIDEKIAIFPAVFREQYYFAGAGAGAVLPVCISQVALNTAPGSTDNLLVFTLPSMRAVFLMLSKSFTSNSPVITPKTSA